MSPYEKNVGYHDIRDHLSLSKMCCIGHTQELVPRPALVPFQLSLSHLLAIPLMANAWSTPHQQNYVCRIMHHHQSVPRTLAHCRAWFPRSRPQQMVPFQLISGKMQLSQTRITRMLLSRIVPVQSARGIETRTIKRPRVP
jgi:hypothetical protein